MTILIANIGTSDLAVKVDDYYIPIGFDRNEPNIDESELNEDEKIAWDRELRDSFITTDICRKLNVEVKENPNGYRSFSFRELTQKLAQAYLSNPKEWHGKIQPARIGGIIDTAINQFNVNKLYLFVTDQNEFILDVKTEKKKFNKGFLTDTINVYELLKLWFKKEQPELELIANIIPKDILPVEQDKLLNYYYKFFIQDEIKNEDIILVSSKGGTGQMQTALKVQALASSNQYLLFIDPILSIKKLLTGEVSPCIFTSYWQHTKGQRYDDVINLLENRWDFFGAIEIIEKWKNLLNFLATNINDEKLDNNQNLISNVKKTLTIASECFNLDIQQAKNIATDKDGNFLKNLPTKLQYTIVTKYNSRLNLYTQCRIYHKLKQSAYLLSTMASFYDAVLEQIARNISCYSEEDYPKKGNRYDKIKYLKSKINNSAWQTIVNNLNKLDFWYDQRNTLIHSASGISPDRLEKVYEEANQQNSETCPPNQIVTTMGEILTTSFNLIHNEDNKFVGNNAKYYIYSTARDWVIEKLQNDLKN